MLPVGGAERELTPSQSHRTFTRIGSSLCIHYPLTMHPPLFFLSYSTDDDDAPPRTPASPLSRLSGHPCQEWNWLGFFPVRYYIGRMREIKISAWSRARFVYFRRFNWSFRCDTRALTFVPSTLGNIWLSQTYRSWSFTPFVQSNVGSEAAVQLSSGPMLKSNKHYNNCWVWMEGFWWSVL